MVGSADTGIKRVGLNRGAAGTYGYGDFMNAQGRRGWPFIDGSVITGC